MAVMKVYQTTAAKLPQLPQVDGQLIFVTDTPSIYLDINSTRINYTLITTFATEQERQNYTVPAEGFYYVVDQNVLWRFQTINGWIRMTNPTTAVAYFGEKETFPLGGGDYTFYSDDHGIYRWDATTSSYIMIAGLTEWGQLV